MSIDLEALVAALNPHCRAALLRASERCAGAGHAEVGIEHLLLALLDEAGNDLACVLARTGVAGALLERQAQARLQGAGRANPGPPVFGAPLVALLREAWLQASLHLGWRQVRSGALLLALAACAPLRAGLGALDGIDRARLRQSLAGWCAGSCEQGGADGGALERYSDDLTAAARAGRIDPVSGRDAEIRQLIDILLRRRQNNPILVGEPGVGKTAVVEGLALRIAAGDVPPPLRQATVRALDLALLQAGAGVQGEFEQRLRQLIDEVGAAASPVILFIDEAHTLIGAGAAVGQGDAANLLKPALARGALRAIAATTWVEYKRYIEKDAALARRFQLVRVDEPSEAAALVMLRALAPRLEQHHAVSILDAALVDAVKLSQRFLPARQLPDKAVSVLDTACARVALAQHDTPPQVEAAARAIAAMAAERARLQQEAATGAGHRERIASLDARMEAAQAERVALASRWQEERATVHEILRLRALILVGTAEDDEDSDRQAPLLAAQLARLESGLEAIRQDEPMVPVCVDSYTVAAVLAGWTGVPIGKMLAGDSLALRSLQARLAQRVIGQDPALALIANRIKAYHAGLTDPAKPVGVFLLVGPSGTGKTETAYALADALFGGERNLIAINLSEYQEAHTVSQLKGAPPGYVGHGTGGVLTEAVRRKPYSVVLLDEFEKAHPDVLDAFYNVFDKGVMEDGTGLAVDFRNTVILCTSNAGADVVAAAHAQGATLDELAGRLRGTLGKTFGPALLARLVAVPYAPLDASVFHRIVAARLARMAQRVLIADPDFFGFDDETIAWVVQRCGPGGVRDIDRVILDELVTDLADAILENMPI